MSISQGEILPPAGSSGLTVAVVSDLHAYDALGDDPTEPSHLCTTALEDHTSQHPITALMDLIHSEKIRADLLMCCGDMTDKARPAGISYVWAKLQTIKQALKATRLVATPGNHDVDSRFDYAKYDPKALLQSLQPKFPLPDDNDTENDKFWSRHYAIVTEDKFRLLILNSIAYHGTKESEYSHGRIDPRTVDAIRKELSVLMQTTPPKINLLLCHHHPHKHGNINAKDYSEMTDGHLLLELLGSGSYGHWVVIHGHKHYSQICYAAGGNSSPVIFGAGSLCANLHLSLQTRARNQFYIITFPLSNTGRPSLGVAGTFEAWDWSVGIGWIRAGSQSGLPAFGAFGCRENIDTLALQVAQMTQASGQPWVQWDEVLAGIPEIKFLLLQDLNRVIVLLNGYDIDISYDVHGYPFQLGARK